MRLPTIQCRYDLGIHEFDRAMSKFSIGLAQYLMMDIWIIKVRVNITRSGFANYIDKQHHEISADILARKWGIGLDKANQTLQSTTRDNVRSSMKPLKWRYRPYFLSQSLHRMNCRFYTENICTKDKYIVGNTCDQILTDGDFSNNSYEI